MKLQVFALCAFLALAVCEGECGFHDDFKVSMKKVLFNHGKKATDEVINKPYLDDSIETYYWDQRLKRQDCQLFLDGMLSKFTEGLKSAERKIIETENAVKEKTRTAAKKISELFGKIVGK
ncbi:uncharacterized protein LOC142768791 [Rhipicephalus microplus]|uniref:uncharacterized protein LOC142768791 n=1 Tax=Rhipicephalus microplus TaxID=6941 RepID=UPI003F6CD475